MGIINWIYLLFALATINMLYSGIKMKSFLSGTQSISTAHDLENFKALARTQMYQSLIQIVVLGGGGLLGLYGIFIGEVGLMLVIGLNVAVFVIAKLIKGMENRVRDLPVNDGSLVTQYRAVCESWVKKPFPDF
jgi:hypothetical protein